MIPIPPDVRKEDVILAVISGSLSYGLGRPDSDVDIRGIVIQPHSFREHLFKVHEVFVEPKFLIGWFGDRFPGKKEADYDLTLFTLAKFMRLAYGNSPSVVDWLFVEPEHILFATEEGHRMIEHRDLFLSRKCAWNYLGYASSELTKLKKDGSPRRMAHLVRILRMVLELLETGYVNVMRHDFEEILEIKNGSWTVEQTVEFHTQMSSRIIAAQAQSKLPKLPDADKLNELYQSLIEGR